MEVDGGFAGGADVEQEVAEKIEVHDTTIGRLERGKIQARPVVLKALLDEYGVTGTERERLLALAREAGQSGWWRAYAGIVSERHLDHIALEAEATRISTWEPIVVPALLQTPDYARAILSDGGVETLSPEQIEQRLKVRMARQERLTTENPMILTAIIDESAFLRPVGGVKVMVGQVARLLEMAQRPNVTIQVLPLTTGAHAGMTGSVTILDFEVDLTFAFQETVSGDMYLDQPADLRVCRDVFDRLRSSALSPAETLKKLAQLAAEGELG